MTVWMNDEEKQRWVTILTNQYNAGTTSTEQILKTKLELETIEIGARTAAASEKNARYMLWSTVAAAISALASLVSTAIAVFWHH